MKPKKFIQESDTRHLSSSLNKFRAPKNDNQKLIGVLELGEHHPGNFKAVKKIN